MEDNCSNCKFGRGRRAEIYCSNTKSDHPQTLTPLTHICGEHGKGEQWEIFNHKGNVIFPKD